MAYLGDRQNTKPIPKNHPTEIMLPRFVDGSLLDDDGAKGVR